MFMESWLVCAVCKNELSVEAYQEGIEQVKVIPCAHCISTQSSEQEVIAAIIGIADGAKCPEGQHDWSRSIECSKCGELQF